MDCSLVWPMDGSLTIYGSKCTYRPAAAHCRHRPELRSPSRKHDCRLTGQCLTRSTRPCVLIYTNDATKLAANLSHDVSKASAIESPLGNTAEILAASRALIGKDTLVPCPELGIAWFPTLTPFVTNTSAILDVKCHNARAENSDDLASLGARNR